MPDWVLPYERCERVGGWDVNISKFEQQSEQRRKAGSKERRGYQLTSSKLIKSQAQAWRDFYNTYFGPTDSFTFEDPVTDAEVEVRFASEIKIRHQGATYVVTLSMEVVNQNES